MKSLKLKFFVVAVLLAGGAGLWWMKGRMERTITSRPASIHREAVQSTTATPPLTVVEVPVESAPTSPVSNPETISTAPETKPAAIPARTKTTTTATPPAVASATPRVRPPKEPIRDPLAREALFFVGMDREAEDYWFEAINDPTLSAHERKDLIEDLNEDGLPDPKHPTLEDLPLIMSRIRLIEAVGWDPLDEVNADAFREAYKDLVNLAYVAIGEGRPVK